ncbi:unnamed protein product [Acanthoscelides obtectus]|uniref:Uncharacterized protein n=1 Tax=Acanthoscelides obtectus TaxID=200917 RepID=A0A9P0P1V9_ACAOB|nr:unnamed protein product [Acanthoscelides obtectus]CAK1657039.1 hypothetical protein AOBTE_LOCUS20080 [Acanthoscelides obtectus]
MSQDFPASNEINSCRHLLIEGKMFSSHDKYSDIPLSVTMFGLSICLLVILGTVSLVPRVSCDFIIHAFFGICAS